MSRLLSLNIFFGIVFTGMLISCGLIPNLDCDIKMTDEYISSTCGVHNGVRFEELKVDSFYGDKTPEVYTVVIAFLGSLDETKITNSHRIYFNDPSGKYIWWTDTSHAVYRKRGIHRKRINIKEAMPDTTKIVEIVITKDSSVLIGGKSLNHTYQYNEKQHYVCPIKFKPDTWYFLDFHDRRYQAYLYVDKNMNYRIDKISLPTNF